VSLAHRPALRNDDQHRRLRGRDAGGRKQNAIGGLLHAARGELYAMIDAKVFGDRHRAFIAHLRNFRSSIYFTCEVIGVLMGAVDVWAQITTERMAKSPWLATLMRWTGRDHDDLPTVGSTLRAMDEADVDIALLSAWYGPAGDLISN